MKQRAMSRADRRTLSQATGPAIFLFFLSPNTFSSEKQILNPSLDTQQPSWQCLVILKPLQYLSDCGQMVNFHLKGLKIRSEICDEN